MSKNIATGKLDVVQDSAADLYIDGWESMLAAVEQEIELTTQKGLALRKSAAILKAKIKCGEPFPGELRKLGANCQPKNA